MTSKNNGMEEETREENMRRHDSGAICHPGLHQVYRDSDRLRQQTEREQRGGRMSISGCMRLCAWINSHSPSGLYSSTTRKERCTLVKQHTSSRNGLENYGLVLGRNQVGSVKYSIQRKVKVPYLK